MNAYCFAFVLLPVVYLAVAARFSEGLRRQPSIVHAWSPDRFTRAVDRAGGSSAVYKGLWFDTGFILLFVSVGTPLLTHTNGSWGLPVTAGCLDLLETVVLAATLNRRPKPAHTRLLALIASCKLLAYFLSLVALAVAWWSVVR